MIAFFDTSAVVPLIVAEAATGVCNRIWNESTRVVTSRLMYPEARAALAQAERMGRINRSGLNAAVGDLDSIVAEVDVIEITAELARAAGDLAQELGLRGYDAVHLAAAHQVLDNDLVFTTGDQKLAAAAGQMGIVVALTAATSS